MDEIKREKRIRKFIDGKLQGALILRVLVYAFCCFTVVTVMILTWRITVSGPARVFYKHFDDLWYQYAPVVIALLLLLPLIMIDVVRFSHRFVGPMLRMRRAMKELAEGGEVEPIRFRKNDFWHEAADHFNMLLRRIQEQDAELAQLKQTAEPSELVSR